MTAQQRASSLPQACRKLAMGMPIYGLTIAQLETVGHLLDRVNPEPLLDAPFSRKRAVKPANLQ